MRFDLSEDQVLLRDATRDFLASESPIEVSRQISEAPGEGFSRQHWGKLAKLGYLGLLCGERAGGQGLGPIELAVVCEEMGRVCFPGPYLDVILATELLEKTGRDDLVRRVVGGEAIVVLASEDRIWPGERGEVQWQDGQIRGTKYFVPFAAAADHLLVTTSGGLVLVDAPLECHSMQTLDEAQRFAEVALDHPALLLDDNAVVQSIADLACVGAAATALGIATSVLEATLAYARERHTFGKPIGSYQALQHRMTDMLLKAESSRSTVYRAAWSLATGQPEAGLLAASAKAWAVEAACHNSREAVQMHGGNGFTWEYNIHRYLKRAMTLEQHYGGHQAMFEKALDAAAGQ